jgi:hypothetical protein
MSVWVAFPTANSHRAGRAAEAWSERGYRVAIAADDSTHASPRADLLLCGSPYAGYFRTSNALCKAILATDPGLVAVVCAADDMLPDPRRTADEIGAEYVERYPTGLGVMQPTGDDLPGTDRICGSPWVGREWILTAYGGLGPLPPDYFHFFGDEQLRVDATARGLLWDRPDLTQRHEHWTRAGAPPKTEYQQRNSDAFWAADKRAFKRAMGELP